MVSGGLNRQWIIEQIKNYSTTSIWSIFLFFGGLIFLLYFARIHYLPELQLSSSISLLAASAFIGVVYLIFFTIALIIPGLIWSTIITKSKTFHPLFYKNEKLLLRRMLLWLLIPFLIFLPPVLINQSYNFIESFMFLLFDPRFSGYFYSWIFLALILFAWIITAFFLFKSKGLILERFKRQTQNRRRKQLLKKVKVRYYLWALGAAFIYWLVYVISCLCFILPIIVISVTDFSRENTPYEFVDVRDSVIFVLFIFTLVINILFAFVSNLYNAFRWRLLIALCSSFLLLLYFEATLSISALAMSIYGFGSLPDSFIVVNPEGCNALRQLGIKNCSNKDEMCRIENVEILSRIGTSYYLKTMNKDGEVLKFSIGSDRILSWGRLPKNHDNSVANYESKLYLALIDNLFGCDISSLIILTDKHLQPNDDEAKLIDQLILSKNFAQWFTYRPLGIRNLLFDLRDPNYNRPRHYAYLEFKNRYKQISQKELDTFFNNNISWENFEQKYSSSSILLVSDISYYSYEAFKSYQSEPVGAEIAYKIITPTNKGEIIFASLDKKDGFWMVKQKTKLSELIP